MDLMERGGKMVHITKCPKCKQTHVLGSKCNKDWTYKDYHEWVKKRLEELDRKVKTVVK
jgi:hypothetical protein